MDLTNSTVKARFLVPKINQLVEQGIEIIDATEGVCRVLIDDSVTVEPGTIQGLLDVFDTNGHKLSVLKFSMIVDEYLGDKDGDITSDTSYPILNQLIESISILRGDLLEAEESRELEDLGGGSYAVNCVPAGLEGLNPVRLVQDMVTSAIEKGVGAMDEINL